MANDENKIILEFPATNVEIEFGETITFDNISGFLDSGRVTYNDESLTDEITHLENDKADKTYVDTELAKKADKNNTYTKTEVDSSLNNKMDKANPTGTGSFSLNRKANTTVGSYSVTTGYRNTASGTASHAESWQTTASGDASHAEGESTIASAYAAHSEGETTTASGDDSHAEGKNSTASGNVSHAEGENNTASGYGSHAEGYGNTASGLMAHAEGVTTESSGYGSHSEGVGTIANHIGQHVIGTYNVADPSTADPTAKGNYIEIVGNGTDDNRRRNARTLDWSGNETLMGDLTYNGNKSLTSEISRLDGKIDNLPAPMIFKGTLGVGGTIQSLPDASASNEGYTYKVITDGTYAGQTAKVGDVFTSHGSAWVYIPSGDEDNDTWRAIKVNGVEKLGNGISSGAVDFVGSENIEVEFDGNGNKVGVKTKNIYTKTEVDDIVSDAIYNVLPDDTASGSVANFETDLALPLKSLEVDVNAVQSGSGYPNPDNVRPISGWSSVNVTRCGKNLLNNETSAFDIESRSYLQAKMPSVPKIISLTDNDTTVSLSGIYFGVFKEAGNSDGGVYWLVSNGNIARRSLDITDYDYITIFPKTALQTVLNRFFVQVEKGTTATSYEPYNGNVTTIPLGQTVHGGTIDLTTGLLRITKGKVVLNGSESWTKSSAYSGGYYMSAWAVTDSIPQSSDHIQNILKTVGTVTEYGQTLYCCFFDNSINIRVDNDLYPTVEDFKTWLSNNNVECVYPLKTPIEVQLTPQEIEAIVGTNNIYADTGDTSVVFKDSVNGYVEKKIASVQALALNT